MTHFDKLLLALAVTGFATATQAYEFKRAELSLGYTQYDSGGSDWTEAMLTGKADFGFTPTFGLQVNASYGQLDFPALTIDHTVIGLHPYYEFAGGNRLGAFVQQIKFSGDGGHLTFQSAGIETIVNPAPNVSFEAYAGVGREEENSNLTDTLIGARVDYGMTDALSAHFTSDFDMFEQGSSSETLSAFGLGVDYHFGQAGSSVPLTLSVDFSRTSFITADVTEASILLTVPLGGGNDTSSRKLFHDRGKVGSVLAGFF